jgi:GT2 family glycosyltransferase
MTKYDVIATVVTFNNPVEMLDNLVKTFYATALNVKLIFIDNSSNSQIQQLANDYNIEYINSGGNIGFGSAHNIGIRKYIDVCDYFLILNPDITLNYNTLTELKIFMDNHPECPLSAPLILNPDQSIQFVHKRHPNLLVLFGRRFLPQFMQKYIQKQLDLFVLKDLLPFNRPIEAPLISGCFMFFRSSTLKTIQGFDERFFMYMEDFDISIRAGQLGKTIFIPNATVEHLWARGSHNSKKLTLITIISIFKFYLKWKIEIPLLTLIREKKS